MIRAYAAKRRIDVQRLEMEVEILQEMYEACDSNMTMNEFQAGKNLLSDEPA